jgi:hypothetical protein
MDHLCLIGVLIDELNVHDNLLLGLQSAELPATTV